MQRGRVREVCVCACKRDRRHCITQESKKQAKAPWRHKALLRYVQDGTTQTVQKAVALSLLLRLCCVRDSEGSISSRKTSDKSRFERVGSRHGRSPVRHSMRKYAGVAELVGEITRSARQA